MEEDSFAQRVLGRVNWQFGKCQRYPMGIMSIMINVEAYFLQNYITVLLNKQKMPERGQKPGAGQSDLRSQNPTPNVLLW
jgi:hypothetical protein